MSLAGDTIGSSILATCTLTVMRLNGYLTVRRAERSRSVPTEPFEAVKFTVGTQRMRHRLRNDALLLEASEAVSQVLCGGPALVRNQVA